MEMKAIRLDYICAAEFKWKAGGAPAPPGSGSERKRTPPPHNPLKPPSTAVFSPSSHMHNRRGGHEPPPLSTPMLNHGETRKRSDFTHHPHLHIVFKTRGV